MALPQFTQTVISGNVTFTDADAAGTQKTILTGGTSGTRITALRAAFAARAAFEIYIARGPVIIGGIVQAMTSEFTTLDLLTLLGAGELLLAAGDEIKISLSIQPGGGETIYCDAEGGDY